MAQQVTYCGTCGTPLAPGATFCGRCGAPVVRPQAVAMPAAYAQYPGYAYPRAQPRPGRIGRDHTTQIAVAIGLVFLLIIGAVAVSLIALINSTGGHTVCIQNCGPKIVTGLPSQATYKSSAFGFEVDYEASWTVQKQTADEIALSTDNGAVAVQGQKSSQPIDQVISTFVGNLPSATYQDVAPVMDVKGAHLGDQAGAGQIYSANFIGSNSNALKVRFAVIAAAKNGVTVIFFAINAADTKASASGIPEAQLFDYMCTEFRWGG